jgi:hypothetical protein
MNFMKGSERFSLIKRLTDNKRTESILLYLVTAYDNINNDGLYSDKIIPKPLSSQEFCKIIGI